MTHRAVPTVGAIAIACAAVVGWNTSATASDCSKYEFSQVKAACESGGAKAVKKLMKDTVKKAKADGKKWKCSTCHVDQKKYENKPGAVDKLREYLN